MKRYTGASGMGDTHDRAGEVTSKPARCQVWRAQAVLTRLPMVSSLSCTSERGSC